MVELTLSEESKIIEGKTFGKSKQIQFVLTYTGGIEKIIKTLV